MARLCCIPICPNSKVDRGVSCFPFPAVDVELRNKWIDFVGGNVSKFRWRAKYICADHFMQLELVKINGQKSLAEGAVPMVYSPEDDEADELIDRDDVMISEEPAGTSSRSNMGTSTAHNVASEDTQAVEDTPLRSLFCRMCLKKGVGLIPFNSKLHNASLVDIIFTITGLKVDTDGELPTKICADCVGKADLAFNIRMEFLHHERILYNLIDSNQLQFHYQSYDNHPQESRSLNQVYLTNLISNVKQEAATEAPVVIANSSDKIVPTQKDDSVMCMKEDLENLPTLGTSVNVESTDEITEIEVLEEFEEEHLYEDDEEEVMLADVQTTDPIEETEQTLDHLKHSNSNNQLKLEILSDSEEEPQTKQKFVFSWKELYKPKPTVVKKPQYKIVEYRPKPKLVPHTCYVCNTSHEDADALEAHMEQHVSILPYKCEQCNTEQVPQVLKTLVSLNRHLMTHLYPYPCDYCPLRFLTQPSYVDHMRSQHEATDTDGFACDYCGQFFNKKRQFYHHLARHKALEDEKYKCEHCGKAFGCSALLKRHRRIHTGEMPFECKKCGKKFNHEANFQNHKRLHIGERAYVCEECGKTFHNGTSLRYHKAEHYPDDPRFRPTPLTSQRSRYQSSAYPKPHIRVDASGAKFYTCEIENCTFETEQYRTFFYHRSMHLKKFKCDLCEKRFPLRCTLTKHIENVHEGKVAEKNLACPYCSKMFSCKQKLSLHVDVHENNRRHKCQFCDKAFVQKANCTAHERIHTGERPHVCRICPAAFITSSGRKKHERTHPELEQTQDLQEGSKEVGLEAEEEEEEYIEEEVDDLEYGEELVEYAPLEEIC
ncbi:zinc finger protein 431-like [Armigeres subalbatus]|uniref:zinc finger protein 431-like n=1 Tax=Armigeres subalbatus TaxID=124917 RepID=UPI002ED17396